MRKRMKLIAQPKDCRRAECCNNVDGRTCAALTCGSIEPKACPFYKSVDQNEEERRRNRERL